MPPMEADIPATAPSHEPGYGNPAEFPAEPHSPGPGDTDHLHTPHGEGADRVDADWAPVSGPEDPLAGVVDAIERLTQLDPADAAAPGAAIADVLSRVLEEEER
jgi:hypothetical protein